MSGHIFVSIRNSNRKTLVPLTKVNSERLFNKAGFSLLEFTIALIIISALVSLLMPKLNDLQDDAHKASVQLTANSLRSAVNLTHSLWQSQGAMNKTAVLKGYGRGNILMGNKGWPVDALHDQDDSMLTTTRFVLNSSTCVRLWNGLLKDTAPKVELAQTKKQKIEEFPSAVFFAELDQGLCRYRYLLASSNLRIEYDLATGRVITLF